MQNNRIQYFNNIRYIVGKNASDNWRIIQEANPEHYWVHLNEIPSCHVIIESENPTKEEFNFAFNLCVKFTKKSHGMKVTYIRKKVKHLSLGTSVGEVIY